MKLTGIEILAPDDYLREAATGTWIAESAFSALDSTQFATAQDEVPDLVLVNPPRRGIGKPLCDFLSRMAPRFIVYSSCNAQTMAKDIRELPGIELNAFSFSICSRTPRIMKC